MADVVAPAQVERQPSPDLGDRVKVSGGLGGGIVLLTGVIAIAGAFEGGPSRIALNSGPALAVAIGAVVLGIALAWLSVLATTRRWWRRLITLAVVSTLGGLTAGAFLSVAAGSGYDRPEVSVGYDGELLSFSGTVSLLRSDQQLIATVYGYPPGIPVNVDGVLGEAAGSELYFANTGPSPEGRATITGQLPLEPDAYEIVEVRVYKSSNNSNVSKTQCLRREEGVTPAGCASVWTTPRPPQVIAGNG